jgi:chemotaxis protein methyltransferase CheR
MDGRCAIERRYDVRSHTAHAMEAVMTRKIGEPVPLLETAERRAPVFMLVTPAYEPALLAGLKEDKARRQAEILRDTAQQRQELLMLEVHHRIANSLQIISSILTMKMRTVQSEESRLLLQGMHRRLISVAIVQSQLCAPGLSDGIAFGPYLTKLCENLSISMIAEGAVTVVGTSSGGTIRSDSAVSFGLIITELVINSLKHGFPHGRKGQISVDFAVNGPDWRLCVSDNGIGRVPAAAASSHSGLGTRIIESVAQHLKATVEIAALCPGTATIISHAGEA